MPVDGPDQVLYEKKGKVVTITLNRPERLNAIGYTSLEQLIAAYERYQADKDAWACVLTGAGRSFCSGDDLKEMRDELADPLVRDQRRWNFIKLFDMRIWKPMIAAIEGHCVAGGWVLAQHCDIRIAAEDAKLGIPETKWNLGAHYVADLTRQMHMGHALEIALWGDASITAQRGYEMGWINRVVPKGQALAEATRWAERMEELGPRSVSILKQTIYEGFYLRPEAGYAYGRNLDAPARNMKDTIEGTKAFAEGRKPTFTNE